MNLDINPKAADRIIELAFESAHRQDDLDQRIEDKRVVRAFAKAVARYKANQGRSNL